MASGVNRVMGVLEGAGMADLDLAEFVVDLSTKCAHKTELGQQLQQFGAEFPEETLDQLWLATRPPPRPPHPDATTPPSTASSKRKRVVDDTEMDAVKTGGAPGAAAAVESTQLPASKVMREHGQASVAASSVLSGGGASSQPQTTLAAADSLLANFLDDIDDTVDDEGGAAVASSAPAAHANSQGGKRTAGPGKDSKAKVKATPATAIPAGFFDDPVRDAKVRKVEHVDPEEEARKREEQDREIAEAETTERLDKQFSLMTTERILREAEDQKELLRKVRLMKEKGGQVLSAAAGAQGGATASASSGTMDVTEGDVGQGCGEDSDDDSGDEDGWEWRRKGV